MLGVTSILLGWSTGSSGTTAEFKLAFGMGDGGPDCVVSDPQVVDTGKPISGG